MVGVWGWGGSGPGVVGEWGPEVVRVNGVVESRVVGSGVVGI